MEKLLNDKEYKRMTEEYDKVKYACKCGHRNVIPNKCFKRKIIIDNIKTK